MSIKANLSGIAVLSENTLIIDYDAVINEANAYGLFIYGQTDN